MQKIIIFAFACLLLADNAFAAKNKTYHTKIYKEKHALGLKRNKDLHKRFLMGAVQGTVLDVSVPAKMDLTQKVSPPENQGQCGSCWAFGVTKALRSALMLVGTDPGTLAFNFLVNNCGKASETHMWGCNGGDFIAGKAFLNGEGPWLESQDHYTQRDGGRCLGLPAKGTALSYKVVGTGGAPSFKELAQVIAAEHMLVIDVAVCGEWGSYGGGIFDANQCGAGSINHMINMNGYDCETSKDVAGNCLFNSKGQPVNGDGYLIVMNNWGTSWGEGGYMRTRWGVDAVADTAMYFEVEKPIPPTPPVPPVPPVPPTPPTPPGDMPPWLLVVIGAVSIIVLILAGIGIQHLFFEKKAS